MKLEFVKQYGGTLCPASDLIAEKMTKFKSGEVYQVEIKRARNPQFHSKVFAFFGFCFEHWCGDHTDIENMDLGAQFDVFRKQLTCMAGYYDTFHKIGGGVRVEAKSLSYGNMEQAEFEECYSALINAAIKHVFKGCNDDQILNRLQGFF